VGALGGEPPAGDTRRVTRLEQELRAVALDNAFGRMTDDVYLRRKSELATQIEAARRPESAAQTVDPKRALGYLNDLRSLWDVELPESPEHQDVRHEYERRRAQATAAGFERLEVLGPVIVEVKLSADPMAGASLALSLQPDKAELVGKQADVVRTLLDGRHSRLARTDTPEARKKRRQRTETGTLRCFGRGERASVSLTQQSLRFVMMKRDGYQRGALEPRGTRGGHVVGGPPTAGSRIRPGS